MDYAFKFSPPLTQFPHSSCGNEGLDGAPASIYRQWKLKAARGKTYNETSFLSCLCRVAVFQNTPVNGIPIVLSPCSRCLCAVCVCVCVCVCVREREKERERERKMDIGECMGGGLKHA